MAMSSIRRLGGERCWKDFAERLPWAAWFRYVYVYIYIYILGNITIHFGESLSTTRKKGRHRVWTLLFWVCPAVQWWYMASCSTENDKPWDCGETLVFRRTHIEPSKMTLCLELQIQEAKKWCAHQSSYISAKRISLALHPINTW